MKTLFAKRNAASQTKQRGQGMTEYIIIVAMVAIAAIAVYQYFGQAVRGQTAALAQELAGEDGSAGRGVAGTAASNAQSKASKATDLKNYVSDNNTGN